MSNFKDELIKQIDDWDSRTISYFFNAYSIDDFDIFGDIEHRELATVKYVDHGTYYNGDGLTQFSVYQFLFRGESHMIKFYGTYVSYVGEDYRGYKFVEPVEKTIIEYEEV